MKLPYAQSNHWALRTALSARTDSNSPGSQVLCFHITYDLILQMQMSGIELENFCVQNRYSAIDPQPISQRLASKLPSRVGIWTRVFHILILHFNHYTMLVGVTHRRVKAEDSKLAASYRITAEVPWPKLKDVRTYLGPQFAMEVTVWPALQPDLPHRLLWG